MSMDRGRSQRDKPETTDSGTIAELRQAALELFETVGFGATTVQEIVERAGVTKGAFYHWYRSKEHILESIHDLFIEHQLAIARTIIESDRSAADQLRDLILELFDTIEHHRGEITVFVREHRFLSEDAMARVRPKRDELAEILTNVIVRGNREGEFREVVAPELLAFGIFGMCAWATEWYRPAGQHVPARDVGEMYANVLIGGLTSRGASST